MPTERVRVTPDYIIAKNSSGTVMYSAGTSPTTGTEFPSYLRSTETSETIDPSLGYDIYYNQLAPSIYPINNIIPGISSVQPQGGTIFSCTQVPTTTTSSVLSLTLAEPGVYVIVPTLWFTEAGTPQNYKSKTVSSTSSTVVYRLRFQQLTRTNSVDAPADVFQDISLARIAFTDGSVGWFGPCDPVSGTLIPVVLEYGISNSQSINSLTPATYETTITIPANEITGTAATTQVISSYYKPSLSIAPSANITSNINSAWTRGIIKILYYSRGYLKMRYTKSDRVIA